MKKKYFSLVVVFVLFMSLIFALTACNTTHVVSVTLENVFVDSLVEYEYGTSIDKIINKDIRVTAINSDNVKTVLTKDEYTLKYYKDNEQIDAFANIPDVGYYTIEASYENCSASLSFYIIPTNNSYYTISLSKQVWDYDAEPAQVTLSNYELKEGDTVEYYCIEKSVYEGLSQDQKKDIVNNGAFVWFKEQTCLLDAGQYYVFADIKFASPSNYTGITVIDNSTLITINKSKLVVASDDLTGIEAIFDYGDGNTGEGIEYILGDIKLGDVHLSNEYINLKSQNGRDVFGYITWENPEQILNSDNNNNTYAVRFVPDNSYYQGNFYVADELTLPVEIKKGIVGNKSSMTMNFDENQSTEIVYDGNSHSLKLENFHIIHYGGEISNAVTFTDKNGETVKIRYEENQGGLVSCYIDGLKDAGEYEYTITINDTTNYCWSDGTTAPLTFKVKIIGDNNILDVSGNYSAVNPNEDAMLENPPAYIQYMGAWMEVGMETTAPDYNAKILIKYNDAQKNLLIEGTLNNQYTDAVTYNSFNTNTNLSDGTNNYSISGLVDTSGTNNDYTITKNGQPSDYIIDQQLDGLIMTALRIDLANIMISADTQTYSVCQDNEYIKVKIDTINSDGSTTTAYMIFDLDGNFVGHKIEVSANDNAITYSIESVLI